MNNITVLVVDDHPLFRQGVVDTLSLEPEFSIVGSATSGEEALDLIRILNPAVAIVDVNLPGLNGQQVTQSVVSEKLPTRIILLTAYDDAEQKIHAIKVGAAAYCVKDVKPEELANVVREVAQGNYVIGQEVIPPDTIEKWLQPHTETISGILNEYREPFEPLSKREMEVLSQITRGLSNKEIASELGISHQTVKNHVTSILRKLGVDDRTQATLYALRRGWVRLQSEGKETQE